MKAYGRHFAVVNTKDEIVFACRTRRQADNMIVRTDCQVIETTVPLPDDIGARYAAGKPYKIKEFINVAKGKEGV